MAYSLMGLFDVTMPVLYGEGAERAFYRLQVEIVKRSDDQSILAWRALPEFDDLPPLRSLFARSPGEFSSNVQAKNQHNRTRMTFVGGDLSIELLLCPCTFISEQNLHYSKGILGILDCVTDDFLTRPAIFLKEDPKGKRGTEFRRDIEESMWFIGPNGRELMQREEYEINAFKGVYAPLHA
jgi:hypothetical protein